MSAPFAHPAVELAARAALDKKASDVVILDLRRFGVFTDFFLLASGANQRQILAIADAIRKTLRNHSLRPDHLEGYPRQEWILLDYGEFVVHIFTPHTRTFYDLERLWAEADRREIAG